MNKEGRKSWNSLEGLLFKRVRNRLRVPWRDGNSALILSYWDIPATTRLRGESQVDSLRSSAVSGEVGAKGKQLTVQGRKDQRNQVRQVCLQRRPPTHRPRGPGPAGPVFPWLVGNVLSQHLREGDSGRRSLGLMSTEVKNTCSITQVWVYVLVSPLSWVSLTTSEFP